MERQDALLKKFIDLVDECDVVEFERVTRYADFTRVCFDGLKFYFYDHGGVWASYGHGDAAIEATLEVVDWKALPFSSELETALAQAEQNHKNYKQRLKDARHAEFLKNVEKACNSLLTSPETRFGLEVGNCQQWVTPDGLQVTLAKHGMKPAGYPDGNLIISKQNPNGTWDNKTYDLHNKESK